MIKEVGIAVRFNIISYFIGEGFRNVFKNKKSTFACLGVMITTMLMFGLFYAIGENITYVVERIEETEVMQVFVDLEATDEQVTRVGEQIRAIEGVSRNGVTHVTRAEAFNLMRSRLGDREAAMAGLPPDMFPDSFKVSLTDLNLNAEVQAQIYELDNIDRITSNEETINTLASIGFWIRATTLGISVIMVGISVFIISNTIKLTVHVRRKEISIMKYVGATNNFIRTPFIIEGIIIGLLSGLLSILVIGGIYGAVENWATGSQGLAQMDLNILGFSNLINQIIVVYILLGMGIGIVGSSISMRKYLDV